MRLGRLEPEKNLRLPQATVVMGYGGACQGSESSPCRLLVLGGRAPAPDWLAEVAMGREIWALDRGADACRTAGVRPDRILGDLDSISDEARRWAEGLKIETMRYDPDKDDTDFQLALGLLEGECVVTGCWGGRFDHAFSNVFSSLWGSECGAHVLCFADDRELLFPLQGPSELHLSFLRVPPVLSLLPLTAVCEGVSIDNAKWPLEDARLLQGRPWAVSNVPLGSNVTISVRSGTLGIYAGSAE